MINPDRTLSTFLSLKKITSFVRDRNKKGVFNLKVKFLGEGLHKEISDRHRKEIRKKKRIKKCQGEDCKAHIEDMWW